MNKSLWNMRQALCLPVMLAVLALAACGGGGGKDGDGGSAPPANQAPTADAGDDQSVDAYTAVEIQGSGSDPDGSIAAYSWKQTAGADVTLSGDDSDTLEFVAPAVAQAEVLTFELTVEDNRGATATDTVNIEVAPVVTLSGRAYDGPIVDAVITVTVGDRSYTATADADGVFTVNIGAIEPDAFVTITATGAEGKEYIELISIAGSFGALQEAAGDDGVLDSEESGNVNVTNISTAKAVLMIEANNGEPITDDATLAVMEGNVSGDDLLYLATVIKLVVDGGYTLPDGVKSTLELVKDAGKTTTFVETVEADDPAAFENTYNDIVSDSKLVSGFAAGTVPAELFTLYVSSRNDTSLTYRAIDRGKTWTFAAGGRGTRSDSRYASTPFDWALSDGKIVVSYDDPLEGAGWCTHPDDGTGTLYRCESTTTATTITLVSSGTAASTLLLSNSGVTTYPEDDLDDVVMSGGSTNLGFRLAAAFPFSAADVPGRWITSATGRADAAVADAMTGLIDSGFLEFNKNGSGQRMATDHSPAETFAWSVTDGVLKIEYVGGDVVRYHRLRRDGDVYDTLALLTRFEGGRHSEAGLMLPMDMENLPVLSEAEWPARYSLFEKANDFNIRLDADGTGANELYAGTEPFDDLPFSWVFREDDVLHMSYYWDVDNGDTASCTHMESCEIYLDRLWYPARYDEGTNRLYLLEIQQRYFWVPETDDFHRGDLRYYQPSVRYWGRNELAGGEGLSKTSAPARKTAVNRMSAILGTPPLTRK